LNGKISTVSIEKLLNYAHRLNMDAQITLKMNHIPHAEKGPHCLASLLCVNRRRSAFPFFRWVGVNAGAGFHQRGLAVIDVAAVR
jgi:hypothetical protein